MHRILTLLAICAFTNVFSLSAHAQTAAPEVTLTRLDCGTNLPPTEVNLRFSDTYAYKGLKLQIVYSCYLIKHGDDYMLWDTGQRLTADKVAPKVPLPELLSQVNVKPEQIKYVGISHYHNDHTGQVGSFPGATLLIGQADWDALNNPKPGGADPATFEHWLKGGGKVEPQAADKDIFGDGTVMMLRTPGHTPGHSSLMVKLQHMGYVLLSGDVVHFRENLATNGVPTFNASRADSLASIDRFKKIAANFKATVIIQHDGRDIAKLPPFPKSAN